jgi:hypothetical protein
MDNSPRIDIPNGLRGSGAYAGEDSPHLDELWTPTEGLEAWIGEHLKEPWAARLAGDAQMGKRAIQIAERNVNGGVE